MKPLSDLTGQPERRFKLKKRAPKLEQKTDRDAVMATAGKYAVLPAKLVIDKFTAHDSINLMRVYHAIATHSNRAGIVACGQQRIATMLGINRKTVGRNIKILRERGLLQLVYRKPVSKNHFINVLRMVHDNGAGLTPRDAAAIAQPDTPMPSLRGHTDSPPVTTARPEGTLHCNTVGHLGVPPLEAHPRMALKENEAYNPPTPLKTNDIIATWTRAMQAHRHQVIATEHDHATAQRCEQHGLTRDQLEGAIADHLLDCQQHRRAPHMRLAPIVSDLLRAE